MQQVQMMQQVQNQVQNRLATGVTYPHASPVTITPIAMAGAMPGSEAVPAACAMPVGQPVSNVELGGYGEAVPVAVVTAVPITTSPSTMQGYTAV